MTRRLTVLGFSVLPIWWDDRVKAGMPSVYLGLKGLVNRGHDVHYVTLGTRRAPRYELVDGIHVHRFSVPFQQVSQKRFWNTFTRLLLWIQVVVVSICLGVWLARRYKPNILYGHTYYGVPAAATVAKLFSIPYIYREYGTMDLFLAVHSTFGRWRRFNEVLAMKLPAAAYILTDDGSRSRDAALALGVHPARINFWKNGLFVLNEDLSTRAQLRQELGIALSDVVCVTAGRLVPNKHVAEIIEAIGMVDIPTVKLIVLGDGEYRGALEELVTQRNLRQRVRFLGAVDRDNVIRYFQMSDVVLALGSINPILEGMALGRAVVCLELGSTHEFVIDGKSGILLKSVAPEIIAEAIVRLAIDASERERIAITGQKTIMQFYSSWEDRIAREVDLVETIAVGGAHR